MSRTSTHLGETMAKAQRWSASRPPGFIVPEALYTLEEAKARLRMGEHAWRQLRRKGVRTIPFGRRHYIVGSTIIEVLKQIGNEQQEG
jgi:hypothetical protein